MTKVCLADSSDVDWAVTSFSLLTVLMSGRANWARSGWDHHACADSNDHLADLNATGWPADAYVDSLCAEACYDSWSAVVYDWARV